MMFKAIFENRILLTIFSYMVIEEAYSFMIQITSTYLFKYYFNAFTFHGIFTSVFNFASIGGVVFGVLWRKKLNSTRKAFLSCAIVHALMLGVVALSFRSLTWLLFVVLMGIAQFFLGMCEAYYLPIFGFAADMCALKTGRRQDGLIMSTYTMSVSVGFNISTLIRTSLLAKVGYDVASYAQGIAPSADVMNMLANLSSTIPCIMAVICVIIIAVGYNLDERKQQEIAAKIKNIV